VKNNTNALIHTNDSFFICKKFVNYLAHTHTDVQKAFNDVGIVF